MFRHFLRLQRDVFQDNLPDGSPKVNTTGIWNRAFFMWVGPFMSNHKPEHSLVSGSQRAESLASRLRGPLRWQLSRRSRHAVLRSIFTCFRQQILIAAFLELLGNLLTTVAPFLLRFLVERASQPRNEHDSSRFANVAALIVGMATSVLLSGVVLNLALYRMETIAAEAKTALVYLVVERAMAAAPGTSLPSGSSSSSSSSKSTNPLNPTSPKPAATRGGGGASGGASAAASGPLFSLLAVDLSRLESALPHLPSLLVAPLSLLASAALLLANIAAVPASCGLAVLVAAVPPLLALARRIGARHTGIRGRARERVGLAREVFRGVRCVKTGGRERRFAARLAALRAREMGGVRGLWALRMAALAAGMALPGLAGLASFVGITATAAAAGEGMADPARVFAAVALFNAMKGPVTTVTAGVTRIAEARVAAGVVEEWMARGEVLEEAESVGVAPAEGAVEMVDAVVAWECQRRSEEGESESEAERKPFLETSSDSIPLCDLALPFRLRASVSIGREELVGVIGGMGSGKSSFLSAVAGQMVVHQGSVSALSSRSISPQQPWVQSATVQANITLGHALDESWYRAVVDACALKPDLASFPNGDLSVVGEGGTPLSGGQRQRISLARAVYQRADIALLDDPLSSVDAQVARHVFDKAIRGLLHGSCRLVVTNQPWALAACDRVLWLDDGCVRAFDNYANLGCCGSFKKLLRPVAEGTSPSNGRSDYGKSCLPPAEQQMQQLPPETADRLASLMKYQPPSSPPAAAPWKTYKLYLDYCGGLRVVLKALTLLLMWQGTAMFSLIWLSFWTSGTLALPTAAHATVYAAASLLDALLSFTFGIGMAASATAANTRLWEDSTSAALHAPLSFHQRCSGEVLDRFSKDTDTIDTELLDSLRLSLMYTGKTFGCLMLMLIMQYDLLAVLAPATAAAVLLALFAQPPFKAAKHRASTLRATLHASLSETLAGLACIRVYGLRAPALAQTAAALDAFNDAHLLTLAQQRWLAIRLDAVAAWALVVASALATVMSSRRAAAAVAEEEELDGGGGGGWVWARARTGLLLSQALLLPPMLRYSVRHLARLEGAMVAVERLARYARGLEQEQELDEDAAAAISATASWPARGELVLRNVCARHAGAVHPVLRDVSLHVAPGEHVAIVGRSGAGKSSLAAAVLRLVEVEAGVVLVDGFDVASVRLHHLRSSILTIPQDPTLFSGSVRDNIDPDGRFADGEIEEVVRQVNRLSAGSGGAKIGLDEQLVEGGAGWSAGRKQLLVIAQALLQRRQISLLDEAASALDRETDLNITRKLRSMLRGRTVVCITHRAESAIRYDKICVLSQGRVEAFGAPLGVYDAGGFLRDTCETAGITREDVARAQVEAAQIAARFD